MGIKETPIMEVANFGREFAKKTGKKSWQRGLAKEINQLKKLFLKRQSSR